MLKLMNQTRVLTYILTYALQRFGETVPGKIRHPIKPHVVVVASPDQNNEQHIPLFTKSKPARHSNPV